MFQVGDKVQYRVGSAATDRKPQGLEYGRVYQVVMVNSKIYAFGEFCTYFIRAVGAPHTELSITNGHLLLSKVGV